MYVHLCTRSSYIYQNTEYLYICTFIMQKLSNLYELSLALREHLRLAN